MNERINKICNITKQCICLVSLFKVSFEGIIGLEMKNCLQRLVSVLFTIVINSKNYKLAILLLILNPLCAVNMYSLMTLDKTQRLLNKKASD